MNTPYSVSQLMIIVIALAQGKECPDGCVCNFGQVTCSGMTSFPTSFPSDTVSINITHMNADEIPLDCLDNLDYIKYVFIQSSTIGRVRSGAFNGHDFMEVIRFDDVKINTIESFAFNNIVQLGTLAFYKSSVENIEMFAFSNMYAFDTIGLYECNITSLATNAFYNVNEMFKFKFKGNKIQTLKPYSFSGVTNIYELSLSYNSIETIGCGNIEKLLEDAYTSVMFMNTVPCSCDLLWVQNTESLMQYLGSNWCEKQSGHLLAWKDISKASMSCSETEVATYHCPDLPEADAMTDITTDYPKLYTPNEESRLTVETTTGDFESGTTGGVNTILSVKTNQVTKKVSAKNIENQNDGHLAIRKDNNVNRDSNKAKGKIVLDKESSHMFAADGNGSKNVADGTGYNLGRTNGEQNNSNDESAETKIQRNNIEHYAYGDQPMKIDENSSRNATPVKVEVVSIKDNSPHQKAMTSAVDCSSSEKYVVTIFITVINVILYVI